MPTLEIRLAAVDDRLNLMPLTKQDVRREFGLACDGVLLIGSVA